jgi:hypothetical protein
MGTSHEKLCKFMIISCSIVLRMRNVSDKSCIENQNTSFVQQLFSENRAIYETMWKNMVEADQTQTTI